MLVVGVLFVVCLCVAFCSVAHYIVACNNKKCACHSVEYTVGNSMSVLRGWYKFIMGTVRHIEAGVR